MPLFKKKPQPQSNASEAPKIESTFKGNFTPTLTNDANSPIPIKYRGKTIDPKEPRYADVLDVVKEDAVPRSLPPGKARNPNEAHQYENLNKVDAALQSTEQSPNVNSNLPRGAARTPYANQSAQHGSLTNQHGKVRADLVQAQITTRKAAEIIKQSQAAENQNKTPGNTVRDHIKYFEPKNTQYTKK